MPESELVRSGDELMAEQPGGYIGTQDTQNYLLPLDRTSISVAVGMLALGGSSVQVNACSNKSTKNANKSLT